jgi:ribonuclease HII
MHIFDTRDSRRLARRANDSKKLSPDVRAELHDALCEWEHTGVVRFAQENANVLEIDAYNILGATRLAMHRCLQTLATRYSADGASCPFADSSGGGEDTPLLDDAFTASPLVLADGRPLRPFAWRHIALVGGDGRSLAIALASILAKVRRDRLMVELGERFPAYGFATHKGYATPEHIAAIRRHGPCPEHRPLFLRSILDNTSAPDLQTEFVF